MRNARDYNVGKSDYAKHTIQPWDIILEYSLNYWDGDIIKRVLRTKAGESRRLEYEKIIHICNERIRQIDAEDDKVEDEDEDEDGTTVFCLSESFKPEYHSDGNVFSVRAVFQSYEHWYAYVGYNGVIKAHLYITLTGGKFHSVRLEDFPVLVLPLSDRLDGIEHSASVKIGATGIGYEKYDYLINDGNLYRYMGLNEEGKRFRYTRLMGNRIYDTVDLPYQLVNYAKQIVCGK